MTQIMKSKCIILMKREVIVYLILTFLTLIFIFLLCLNFGLINIYKSFHLQIIADMDNQNKLSQDNFYNIHKAFPKQFSVMNNYPKQSLFYPFEPQEFSEPEKKFTNPLPRTSFVLMRGKTLFHRFCIPCHDVDGKGNGPVVTQVVLKEDEEGFPPPKDLTSETTKKLSDGRLFHILSAGQNLMFSYHDKLTDFDKWALIHYLRELQIEK